MTKTSAGIVTDVNVFSEALTIIYLSDFLTKTPGQSSVTSTNLLSHASKLRNAANILLLLRNTILSRQHTPNDLRGIKDF